MTIVIVSATPFEIAPLQQWLSEYFEEKELGVFVKGTLKVVRLVTGVGMVKTAFHLATHLTENKADLYVNAGIAGTYTDQFPIGTVVNVVADRFGDLGVEEANGTFTDVHELSLIAADDFPFQEGLLQNPTTTGFDFLPKAIGITVNKVHGTQQSIDQTVEKYSPEIESMEGAAFAYACLSAKVNYLQIRSISNKVEPRNRENWDLPLAIEKLNEVLVGLVNTMEEARRIY